jgi:uncharacterized protein (DUF302 family)
VSNTTNAGLVELASPIAFEAMLHRVTEAIEAAGLTVFARIDHSDNARQAGLMMPPAIVLIYGHAKGGTPIMVAAPQSALDLPLRVLVHEAGEGTVVAFRPIAPVLLQAGVPEDLARRLDPAQHLLVKAVQS